MILRENFSSTKVIIGILWSIYIYLCNRILMMINESNQIYFSTIFLYSKKKIMADGNMVKSITLILITSSRILGLW